MCSVFGTRELEREPTRAEGGQCSCDSRVGVRPGAEMRSCADNDPISIGKVQLCPQEGESVGSGERFDWLELVAEVWKV